MVGLLPDFPVDFGFQIANPKSAFASSVLYRTKKKTQHLFGSINFRELLSHSDLIADFNPFCCCFLKGLARQRGQEDVELACGLRSNHSGIWLMSRVDCPTHTHAHHTAHSTHSRFEIGTPSSQHHILSTSPSPYHPLPRFGSLYIHSHPPQYTKRILPAHTTVASHLQSTPAVTLTHVSDTPCYHLGLRLASLRNGTSTRAALDTILHSP